MLRVHMSQAIPDMVLAQPVYHPRAKRETVLLRVGAKLTEGTIARMQELRVPQLWIQYPGMEMVGEFISPKILRSRARVAADVSEAFIDASQNAHAKLDFNRYKSSMSDLLSDLIEDPKGAIFVGELVDSGAPAVRHGANVGFLAMLLGLKLGFYIMKERKHVSAQASKDVTNLGVAGMLHDIGMLHLEERVRERWIEHHDATDKQWQEHVKLGYQSVRGQINASSASAVLNHHQHFDGSGFPKKKLFDGREEGIAGDNIHVFARILCTADLFDRLSNKASFEGEDPGSEPTKPAVCAIKTMMEPPYVDWIDPVVFKALLSVCPAYPPGTRVKLSNGAQGVVTDWDPTDPCRPQVHEFSRFEDEEFVAVHELKDNHSLTIVESEGVDVREMNFYPKSKQQFDLRALQKNLANALHSFEDDGGVENTEQAA